MAGGGGGVAAVRIALLLLVLALSAAENMSSSSHSWSVGVGVGGVQEEEGDDGGFSSLESMLQWAIGHSDPAKLKDQATDIQRLSTNELNKRQLQIKAGAPLRYGITYGTLKIRGIVHQIDNWTLGFEDKKWPSLGPTSPTSYLEILSLKVHHDLILQPGRLELAWELMEELKMPSDTELMRIAIDDLNNSSISLEDRQRALNELLVLVEPIDNANDLDKFGGLVAVVRELYNSDPEIRTTSAWILGKASQNNVPVQNQILALGVLTRLMKMVKSSYTEEAVKSLYAISALIVNNGNAQELFYTEDGDLLLKDIMSNSSIDIRLQKKTAVLVADLADYQLENPDNTKSASLSNHFLIKSVVDLTSSTDLDLQEKALLAIRSLLQLTSIEALDFKDYCNLDGILERIRDQLEKLMVQDEATDYVRDMESLRQEVYNIFHRKLETMQVQT